MVRDGYAMGVAAKVVKYVLGAAEGWFGVDDPIFAKHGSEAGGENPRLSEWNQIAEKGRLPPLQGRLEAGDELTSKYTPEHVDGEKGF
jgi:hypothetical protein